MQIPGRPALAKPEACRRAAPASVPVSARLSPSCSELSHTQRTGAEEPAKGQSVRIQRLLFFFCFVFCFLFFSPDARPAGWEANTWQRRPGTPGEAGACVCVCTASSSPAPPSSSAAASGPMSLMQFWTKFYSQLGRPLPKVPVPFASSASVQTELTNSFVKWLFVTVAVSFFFLPSNLCQCSVSWWLTEVEALS